MANVLEIYLQELDTDSQTDTLGEFVGADSTLIGPIDGYLYYQSPVAIWQNIFTFKTDGTVDLTEESSLFSIKKSMNIITAATGAYDVEITSLLDPEDITTRLYTPIHNGGPQFVNHRLNDDNAIALDKGGEAARIFVGGLSSAVFGSPDAIDLFTNEDQLADSFATSVEECVTKIGLKFQTPYTDKTYSDISDDGSNGGSDNQLVAKRIWDQLFFSTPERFRLGNGVTDLLPSPDDGTYDSTGVTSVSGTGAGAVVKVHVLGNIVTSVELVSVATANYIKGEIVTITFNDGSNAVTFNITCNSVQAAILNGLQDTDVEFPLIENDAFHIKLEIKSPSGQKTSAKSETDIQEFSKYYDLKILLGPNQ